MSKEDLTRPVPEGLAERAAIVGSAEETLTDEQARAFIAEQLAGHDFDGKTACIVIPDGTRSGPHALMIQAAYDAIAERAGEITILIALGTHADMSTEAIERLVGGPAERFPRARIVNHDWKNPAAITTLGTVPAEEISRLTQGLLSDRAMDVQINSLVADADVNLVIGPVFPHEVVGFSGGNKYFFPGCSVHDVIDISHWVGALITASRIIGTSGITPVRQLIDTASEMIAGEKLAITYVATGDRGLHSVAFGDTQSAWAANARVAARTHIKYVEKPYRRIVSKVPEMYEDLWTGAKGVYKMEPVCADGGEIIVYAPHITEISEMHPGIAEIGYHCIDYFTKQWERFKYHPWGEIAHSTHVRGLGTYDPATDTEELRINITLATRVPREVCEAYNLGYTDPDSLDFAALSQDPDTLVVEHAGEILHRLESERP
ncbi:lactate racemase domain-containing protein [Corynebacterium doosanense]|uniref:LarA-like N-terminal domain-containing protein n=1 Tax=Corynebacterium doosanense CAU 212 = DSM 45436 TaxID=558173 RepID=A0A097IIK5_9CORY|nr:lactate racemase domain-containing protein [Corynebacterium doosanense]AIT61972.1 hypothetical protein CDOO_12430 [Corynebacterium doosanense CAU 212 = DSM 45436]